MMKKILLLTTMGLFALTSCSETDEVTITPENVEFTISFGFAESGSMSRSGATAYEEFYNNYIATKELTPDTYTLTFKQSNETIAVVNGGWESADIITLPAGTYTVTGTSGSNNSDYSSIARLSFSQDIEITSNTTNVNLTADYNCLLLMLDGTVITAASYNTNAYTSSNFAFYEKDDIYYIFLYDAPSSNYYTEYIRYTTDAGTSYLYIDELGLEIGKYYYYDCSTGSFDIPPMTAGN